MGTDNEKEGVGGQKRACAAVAASNGEMEKRSSRTAIFGRLAALRSGEFNRYFAARAVPRGCRPGKTRQDGSKKGERQ